MGKLGSRLVTGVEFGDISASVGRSGVGHEKLGVGWGSLDGDGPAAGG